MTEEKELREILTKYGIGLEIVVFAKKDHVNIYPTRYKGIHKESLSLRGHLADCPLPELLKYCLSNADYKDWQTHVPDSTEEKKQ